MAASPTTQRKEVQRLARAKGEHDALIQAA
jgi:hypothetical protein